MKHLAIVVMAAIASAPVQHDHGAPAAPRSEQANPVAPAPAPVPTDDVVTAWIETVQVASQLISSECPALEQTKQFEDLKRRYTRRIETRLPGYTVNWASYEVVPKPLPQK